MVWTTLADEAITVEENSVLLAYLPGAKRWDSLLPCSIRLNSYCSSSTSGLGPGSVICLLPPLQSSASSAQAQAATSCPGCAADSE